MPTRRSPDREAFWRNLMAHREAAKLTVVEACQEAGVSLASFFYWQRKFLGPGRRRGQHATRETPLVPVRIVDDRVGDITLETPGGIRICVPQGCDEVTLQRANAHHGETAHAPGQEPFRRERVGLDHLGEVRAALAHLSPSGNVAGTARDVALPAANCQSLAGFTTSWLILGSPSAWSISTVRASARCSIWRRP